jgi:hypothetical protein
MEPSGQKPGPSSRVAWPRSTFQIPRAMLWLHGQRDQRRVSPGSFGPVAPSPMPSGPSGPIVPDGGRGTIGAAATASRTFRFQVLVVGSRGCDGRVRESVRNRARNGASRSSGSRRLRGVTTLGDSSRSHCVFAAVSRPIKAGHQPEAACHTKSSLNALTPTLARLSATRSTCSLTPPTTSPTATDNPQRLRNTRSFSALPTPAACSTVRPILPRARRDRHPLVDTGRHHHQHLLVRMQGDAQPECVGPCLHGARMNSGGHQEELAPLQRPNAPPHFPFSSFPYPYRHGRRAPQAHPLFLRIAPRGV